MLGVINVLKPTGLTSSDVVVRVRGYLRKYYNDKNIKVGHLGTLDPNGSGVLPIVFGKATRLFDYCVKDRKCYRVCFKFGVTTDTLDSDGVITFSNGRIPQLQEIEAIINDFVGEIDQIPPQYSSISVGGIKGYEAARKGESIEIASRKVFIYDIKFLRYTDSELWLDVDCGGGTYMRSLCRDISEKLGTLAYMPCIIRLENKGMSIENSMPLDDIKDCLPQCIMPVEHFINDLQKCRVSYEEGQWLLNGVDVKSRQISGDYLLYIDGKLFGICRDDQDKIDVAVRLWE